MEVARILNQAEELSLYLDQSCEFDSWPFRSSIGWQYYRNLYNPIHIVKEKERKCPV
jgi:hypothetical protein